MTTTFPVGQLSYPTATQIRDQILLDLGFFGERVGIVYNTKPGSDYFKLATALANRVAIAIANNQLSNDARNPLIAEGSGLRDICRAYGIEPRPASGSAGSAIVKTSSTLGATIPAGWRATAPNGKKYDVSSTTTVSNGDTVSIISVAIGADTELAAGTQLTWDSAAIATLLNPLTVDGAGITGGTDTDDEDDLRRRLLDRLRSQAVGGNAASIKGWAEEVSAQIERAFVYQGLRGPCTIDVAVTRESTARTVSADIVDQSRANVISMLPGGTISVVATTVVPQPLDVVIELGLPLPATAGGTGGGWSDSSPWPEAIVKVTNVAGAILTVNGSVSPTVGNNIGLWDRSVEPPVMRGRRILTAGGSSGAWTLTVDGSTAFVAVGDIVSAGASNISSFAEVIRAEFADLGPGEKTDDDSILPRAARYPNPELQQPFGLTSAQLTALQSAHPVIFDLAWFARFETGTATTRTSPSLPPAPADPPRILTIRNLAFIRKST